MTTSLIAMGAALFAVVNIVVGLGVLSLLFGTFETLFGKPKLTFLKPTGNGPLFAFGFKWNSAKEPARFDQIRLRLFNPFGSPTQVDVHAKFEEQRESFALEVNLGPGFLQFLGAKGFESARVQVEVISERDGVTHQFEMKGSKFKELLVVAEKSVAEYIVENKIGLKKDSNPPIDIPVRSFIADTVPGRGPQLKIATNPVYSAEFAALQTANAGAGGQEEAQVANYAILKVWIEPGCIVCNACEDIYPEVFEVKADTCIVRPNPPLDNGLRVQEAAEACPVEVIKFTKAS